MTLSGKADTAGMYERSRTPSRCAGVVATGCTQGKRAQHGKPIERPLEVQMRQRDGGFQGIADDIAQSVVSLQPFAGVPKILPAFNSEASVPYNSTFESTLSILKCFKEHVICQTAQLDIYCQEYLNLSKVLLREYRWHAISS